MTSDVHARDSVMTSLYVTRHTRTPGLTLLVYWGVWERWSTFLMKNNFLTLIVHFFKNIRHSDALSINTVKLNSTGKRKICKNVDSCIDIYAHSCLKPFLIGRKPCSNRKTHVQIMKFTCRLNMGFGRRHWSK